MKTPILINPVAALPRPVGSPSDHAPPELLSGFFAGLIAGSPDGPPPSDRIETVPEQSIFAVPPENGLPVRTEPIGAVQGLAEATMMSTATSESDPLWPETPQLGVPLPEVVYGDPIAEVVARPVVSIDLASAALVPVGLPLLLPHGVTQTPAGHETDASSTPDGPERGLSATATTNLLHLPVITDGSLPLERLAFAGLSGGTARSDVGSKESAILVTSLPQPPLTGSPADDASQFKDRTNLVHPLSGEGITPAFALRTADQGPQRSELIPAGAIAPVESERTSAVAKLAALLPQVPANSAAAGAAFQWQTGLAAEVSQSATVERAAKADTAPTGLRTYHPSAALLHYEGPITPNLQLPGGLLSSLTFLAALEDSDPEIEAGFAPGFGPVPTNGNAVVGNGHPVVSVGLQDLPRLAAQLAGTLIQRADGQTEVALSPEELGHVRLSMQADAQNPDRIVVMLTFERPETLDLFRRHADQLADALREAGYSGADISYGRSGENAREGTEPNRPEPVQQDGDHPNPDAEKLPSHQPSKVATTGSLDLRL